MLVCASIGDVVYCRYPRNAVLSYHYPRHHSLISYRYPLLPLIHILLPLTLILSLPPSPLSHIFPLPRYPVTPVTSLSYLTVTPLPRYSRHSQATRTSLCCSLKMVATFTPGTTSCGMHCCWRSTTVATPSQIASSRKALMQM